MYQVGRPNVKASTITYLFTVLVRNDGTSRRPRISSKTDTFWLPCCSSTKLDAYDGGTR